MFINVLGAAAGLVGMKWSNLMNLNLQLSSKSDKLI